jgi:anti-sigma factor RsiW
MKCQAVRTMFSEYVDQELTPGQKEAVDLHTRDCPACREELAEQLALHGLFAAAERIPAPFGFSTRVMANLETEKEGSWARLFARPFFLRVMEVAFALIVVIIGLVSGNLITAHQPPSDLTSTEVRRSFALDVFEAAPSGSLGGVYVSMTGVRNEE